MCEKAAIGSWPLALSSVFSFRHRFDFTIFTTLKFCISYNLKDLRRSRDPQSMSMSGLMGVFMRYHVSVVAEFFIRIVVALALLLLWLAVVTLIGRAFGVRVPFFSLRQRNGISQRLTFSQHMWLNGVLGWGCGMWIFTTFYDYLKWYWSGSAHHLSAENLLLHAALWGLGGVLFGWMTWKGRTGTAES